LNKHLIVLLALATAASAFAQNQLTETTMTKHALIVVTSHGQLGDTGKQTGWYLSEVSHVYYPLAEAGFSVDFASPKGGDAPMDEKSRKLDDPLNKRFLEDENLRRAMEKTIPLSQIDPGKYEVVHFAGGHGTMWDFPTSDEVARVAAAIYEKGGIVAAVCHGPAALVNVKLSNGKHLVEGKDVTGFTNGEEKEVELSEVVPFLLESKLAERGANFQAAKNWADNVVHTERLVTGQNPQSASSLGKKIVELSREQSLTK
jgi:putative intracellular protease/amidase